MGQEPEELFGVLALLAFTLKSDWEREETVVF